ncbi:hypothetical protein KAR91_12035 [Candidatus Pacearchaeota archaeon]|nr:hypothetical protein [Candidatus Pacearchaeota archaeon]
MGTETWVDKIRNCIAWICWKGFLWSSKITEEEYWNQIYAQESHKDY